jgi:hypothetical protein
LELGAQRQGETAQLEWRTVGEENLLEMILEQQDRAGVWQVLSRQLPSGQAGGTAMYYAVDPELHPGLNAYRVRAVDRDGGFRFSNQAEVYWGSDLSASVAPNPGAGQFTFLIHGLNGESGTLRLMDFHGKVLLDTPVLGEELAEFALDLSGVADGIYFYEVKAGGKSFTGKLVKQQ